jgi:hypothetical protein
MATVVLRLPNDTDVQLQHPSDSEEAVSCNVGLASDFIDTNSSSSGNHADRR